MVDVQRKKGETFESFLRRFSRRLMLSGTMLQARKVQFYKKKTTKRERRVSALRRKTLLSKLEQLRRIGREPEEKKRRGRR